MCLFVCSQLNQNVKMLICQSDFGRSVVGLRDLSRWFGWFLVIRMVVSAIMQTLYGV